MKARNKSLQKNSLHKSEIRPTSTTTLKIHQDIINNNTAKTSRMLTLQMLGKINNTIIGKKKSQQKVG